MGQRLAYLLGLYGIESVDIRLFGYLVRSGSCLRPRSFIGPAVPLAQRAYEEVR